MTDATMAGRLRAARLKRKLTQVQLAETVGIQQSQVTRFENGERTPTIPTMIKLVAALRTTVGAIVDEPRQRRRKASIVAEQRPRRRKAGAA